MKQSERLEELYQRVARTWSGVGAAPIGWIQWEALKAWADERFPQPEARSEGDKCPSCHRPDSECRTEPTCLYCCSCNRQLRERDADDLPEAPPSQVERGLVVELGGKLSWARAKLGFVQAFDGSRQTLADAISAIDEILASAPLEVPAGETPTAGADPFEAGSDSKTAAAGIERSLRKRIAELEAQLHNAEAKLAETRRAAWSIRDERDQLQESLRLLESVVTEVVRGCNEAHSCPICGANETHDPDAWCAKLDAALSPPPAFGVKCCRCGKLSPGCNYCDECFDALPKPTPLSPTQDTQERQQPNGPEPKHVRHDGNSSDAEGGAPGPSESGLDGRAPGAPGDHRRAEGGAENAGAGAGDHEAGRGATVGRRSDDGGVAEPAAGEPVVPVGEAPKPMGWRDTDKCKCDHYEMTHHRASDGAPQGCAACSCIQFTPVVPAPPSPAVPDVKRALELLGSLTNCDSRSEGGMIREVWVAEQAHAVIRALAGEP